MPQIDRLFQKMLDQEASDLHLSTGVRPHLRVHGNMVELEDEEVMDADVIAKLVEEITPPRNLAEFKEIADTDFAYQMGGTCRFRSNLFQDMQGPGAVFRTIPSRIQTADELELSEHVKNLTMLPKGLILVTGPTGSGKSTTLAALINEVNLRRRDHIITIEDPIEFVHQNHACLINQREVHQHTAGFKPALRAALREDPDVILIGELRDLETIEIAMETAETGHLVFGTLHTTTAASTVDRIIDSFPADRQDQIRAMLSTSLRAVIAQTLCRRADGRARVGCYEVLMVNSAVASLIREGKTYQIPSIIQTGGKYGMVLQNSALQKLVKRRLVTYEEALLKATDREGLERLLPEEARRFKQQLGSGRTFAADMGMPISSTGGDEGVGPRIGGDGILEGRALRKSGAQATDDEETPAQRALAAAKARIASKATQDSAKSDDFDTFRKKLASRRA